MLIFDGDYPMAYGAVDLNRDLTQPIDQVRSDEPGLTGNPGWPDSETMATLPEMRCGGVAAALVKIVARIERPGSPLWGHRSPQTAYAAAQSHLAYYRILDSQGEARILRTRNELTDPYSQIIATNISTDKTRGLKRAKLRNLNPGKSHVESYAIVTFDW